MKLKCTMSVREWLRSPAKTFLVFRECVRTRGNIVQNIAMTELRWYSEDPKEFARKYFSTKRLVRSKIKSSVHGPSMYKRERDD